MGPSGIRTVWDRHLTLLDLDSSSESVPFLSMNSDPLGVPQAPIHRGLRLHSPRSLDPISPQSSRLPSRPHTPSVADIVRRGGHICGTRFVPHRADHGSDGPAGWPEFPPAPRFIGVTDRPIVDPSIECSSETDSLGSCRLDLPSKPLKRLVKHVAGKSS
jgi:hypothetical protein